MYWWAIGQYGRVSRNLPRDGLMRRHPQKPDTGTPALPMVTLSHIGPAESVQQTEQ